jgi:hypothetical protein
MLAFIYVVNLMMTMLRIRGCCFVNCCFVDLCTVAYICCVSHAMDMCAYEHVLALETIVILHSFNYWFAVTDSRNKYVDSRNTDYFGCLIF